MHDRRGIVLFGDVIDSRREPERASAWLRSLRAALEQAIPSGERLAQFGMTQGDELQGLLTADADPFRAILVGCLDERALPMRWVVSAGPIDPGRGPAIERTGPAFLPPGMRSPRPAPGATCSSSRPASRVRTDSSPRSRRSSARCWPS